MTKKRVVILGLDGMDPKLVARWMEAGLLPNCARLRDQGTFSPLTTTNPPETAAAWSALATGTNPGKTGILDFVIRDPKTYAILPGLSRVKRGANGRPELVSARSGDALWKLLGVQGLRSTILNLPVTWPPEDFNGRMLSGMGTPDLNGTMGSYTHYSTAHAAPLLHMRGRDVQIEEHDGEVATFLYGPNESTVPLHFRRAPGSDQVTVTWPDGSIQLQLDKLSDWCDVNFATENRRVLGLCRFALLELEPHLRVYCSSLMNHPRDPYASISSPPGFAQELYAVLGPYRTMGREVDIFSLLENVLDDAPLLADTFQSIDERERLTLHLLDDDDALLLSWFGVIDTTQHGYWRFVDTGHPLYSPRGAQQYGDAVQHVYQRLDQMVGRVLARITPDTLLLIASDHGCANWRRSVHMNTWLMRHGYLALAGEHHETLLVDFAQIDWQRTRAYSVGCGKIYINLQGREGQGVVASGAEYEALLAEIAAGLEAWQDPQTGGPVVSRVYRSRDVQWGPHMRLAPDLIVGLKDGYRVAWTSLRQVFLGEPLEDNLGKISSDHISMDYALVPGTLLSNWRLDLGGGQPHIMDLAPTVLDYFGLEAPAVMDGRSRWPG